MKPERVIGQVGNYREKYFSEVSLGVFYLIWLVFLFFLIAHKFNDLFHSYEHLAESLCKKNTSKLSEE